MAQPHTIHEKLTSSYPASSAPWPHSPHSTEWADPSVLAYEDDTSGIDIVEKLQALWRWRWLILAVFALGVGAGIARSLYATPIYRAVSTVEISPQETQIIEGAGVEPIITADAEFIATQLQILKSRSLVQRVAEVLDLPSNPLYADPDQTRIERLKGASNTLYDNLSVSIVGRSRILEIRYDSPSPTEARRIANSVADEFINSNLERKYNATAYARQFIQERIAATKSALEESERKLFEYAQSQGILDLTSAGGSAIGGSLDASSITTLNAKLTDIQTKRIAAEALLRNIESEDQRLALNSELLRGLAEKRSEVIAALFEMKDQFQPDFPMISSLEAQLEVVDQEIELERNRIAMSIQADFNAALEEEKSTIEEIDRLKGALQDLRGRSIEYNILSRDVDTNRSQYEALLQRLKEIGVAAGVGVSQVTIVDRAETPTTPIEPSIRRNLVSAGVLSLALAIGLSLALDILLDRIKSPEDIKTKLDLPLLGSLPFSKTIDPQSALARGAPLVDAVGSLRTALQFSLSTGTPKSLLVSSARAGEGKSTTGTLLALAFARIGKRVLIIDGDLRKPSFAANSSSSIGLSGLLTKNASLLDEVIEGPAPNIYLLPAGETPPDPAEILSSVRLNAIGRQAEEQFDLVLVDSPPILGFADARLLATICEASMLIVQAGKTARRQALHAISTLSLSNVKIIGGILTKDRASQFDYGYYGDGSKQRSTKTKPHNSRDRRAINLFLKSGTPPKPSAKT